jgi:hypothetical protein
VLFGRGDFRFVADGLREETLWLLGEAGVAEWDRISAAPPKPDFAALVDSGIYVMAGGGAERQLVDGCRAARCRRSFRARPMAFIQPNSSSTRLRFF